EGALMLAPSTDGSPCLRAYPMQEWRATEDKLAGLDDFDPRGDELIRLFVGPAIEVELDKVGRVLVPPALRESIGVGRAREAGGPDVTFVGKLRHCEIWGAATYREYTDKQRSEGKLPRALKELSV